MLTFPRCLISFIALLALAAMNACAPLPQPPGQWIHFNPATQRYSIDAQAVPRGALLDQLAQVAKAEVRPQPERDVLVTAQGRNLDLDALVALVMPKGVRATIRPGEREIPGAIPAGDIGKKGVAPQVEAIAAAKPDPSLESQSAPQRDGAYKTAPDAPPVQGAVSGPGAKAPAKALPADRQPPAPKQPLPSRVERATVHLTLQFDDGSAPRLVAANLVEGRVPEQRFVVGTFLFSLVAADGRVLEAGTFSDPLIARSYQEKGPHQVLRAKSGVAAISVLREHLAGSRLYIVDMTGIALPRELTDDVARRALEQGRTVLALDADAILRNIEQENPK